jgi:hypothetical protein
MCRHNQCFACVPPQLDVTSSLAYSAEAERRFEYANDLVGGKAT